MTPEEHYAEAQMRMRYFYVRVNREPRKIEPCAKPCCAVLS